MQVFFEQYHTLISAACCLNIPLSHNGCLAEFCIYQAINCHDIPLLHCCLIRCVTRWKISLAHLSYSYYFSVPTPHHRQKDTIQYTSTLCTHTHTHTHTCHLFISSEKLMSNIPGWCTPIQNLSHDNWELPSDQTERNNYYRFEDKSVDNIIIDSGRLMITTLKILVYVQTCSNCLSLFLKC